jgi:5-methylcytosine-specific restriction endonuclease McrA
MDAKNSAKHRGLCFELTEYQLKELRTGVCAYCGQKNEIMTVDRKNNNFGYTFENCVSCCYQCNSIKGPILTFRQMMLLGIVIKEIRQQNPKFWVYTPNWTKKPNNV